MITGALLRQSCHWQSRERSSDGLLSRESADAEKCRLSSGLDLATVVAKVCMLLPFTPHSSSLKQAGPVKAAPNMKQIAAVHVYR
jgi:hypothetical protein